MELVFPAVLLALSNLSSLKAEDAFQQNNRLGRGVNLLGGMPSGKIPPGAGSRQATSN